MVDAVTDAEYLKSSDLGGVIAKGMAVMYQTDPKNPVDFLAKWLLNYSQVQRADEDRQDALALVEQNMKQHEDARALLTSEQSERKKVEKAVDDDKQSFLDKIAAAHDLSDNLQDLTDHIKKYTNASAVYVGKLVSPKKSITDDDDDTAHVDDSGEKIIHFSHANSEHDFLVDKVLKKTEGLTFDVFNDRPATDDQGEPIVYEDLEHVLVKEVVREPRIHFYKVPRLGSYLAIRLEYNSCLY